MIPPPPPPFWVWGANSLGHPTRYGHSTTLLWRATPPPWALTLAQPHLGQTRDTQPPPPGSFLHRCSEEFGPPSS